MAFRNESDQKSTNSPDIGPLREGIQKGQTSIRLNSPPPPPPPAPIPQNQPSPPSPPKQGGN